MQRDQSHCAGHVGIVVVVVEPDMVVVVDDFVVVVVEDVVGIVVPEFGGAFVPYQLFLTLILAKDRSPLG